MSKVDIPTPRKIAAGVAKNAACQAAISKPLPECAELCTLAAILEGKPVIAVHQFGYISCSAFDVEDNNLNVPALGELLEVRPLEAGDEWHPERTRVVFLAAKFPRTARLKSAPVKPVKPPKVKPKTVVVESDDDNDALARELGLLD
jgi:hypothetical protein